MAEPQNNFIRLRNYEGRALFYSETTGTFWSIGVNSFMEPWDNDPLEQIIQPTNYQTVYDNELQRITQHGFNSLSAWSSLDGLKERAPFGVMLFDDEKVPLMDPLLNAQGQEPPQGDGGTPCPLRDPYSKKYQAALDDYIKERVSKFRDSKMLLCYWIGHEFGLSDTEPIDFSQYLYSKGVSAKLKEWLIKKYKTIEGLNKAWSPDYKDFDDAAKSKVSGPGEQRKKDLREFAALVIHDWFDLVIRTIKKYDPNHLISSPKLSVYDSPPHLQLPLQMGQFESFRGHFDLLSVDMYSKKEEYPEALISDLKYLNETLHLPVLVAEFGTRQEVEGWNNKPGARSFVKTQAERADRYRSQVTQLFGEPFIIGAHWFKWSDHQTKKHQMNKGMIYVEGNNIVPYSELMSTMRAVNLEIDRKVKQSYIKAPEGPK